MKVLSVAAEVFPLIKTGGLADVAGALPGALVAQGVAVQTLLPGYPAVTRAMGQAATVLQIDDLFGGPAALLAGRAAGLDLLVIDAPHLFARDGNPYSGPDGQDWPDNAFRFAALGRLAAEIGRGLVAGFVPDIVHAHDWQAGLAPAYLKFGEGRRPATVMTVHNLAFQGQFPAGLLGALGFPAAAYDIDGLEYYGSIGFLKAGLVLADRVTTVSPSYAAEIRTPAGGMGLDGLLRARGSALVGILNGIDEAVWNPATDAMIPARFDAAHPGRRRVNKAALQTRLGLNPDPEVLLFGVVTRLTLQKGMDLLAETLPFLRAQGAQLAVLGSGDRALERMFADEAAAYPGAIGMMQGYDEALAHLIQAGSDALLVPSRFEPCGLTQLCALRYGAVPVVARVGGLTDTIVDANEMALAAGVATGLQFAPVGRDMLEVAIARTAALWRNPPIWQRIQSNGMATEVGWRGPAGHYAALYKSLV